VYTPLIFLDTVTTTPTRLKHNISIADTANMSNNFFKPRNIAIGLGIGAALAYGWPRFLRKATPIGYFQPVL